MRNIILRIVEKRVVYDGLVIMLFVVCNSLMKECEMGLSCLINEARGFLYLS